MSAIFSPCRTWRYELRRETGLLSGHGAVVFVGLNPSTADETQDDPTVRRCLGFARGWGYAELVMANVYAFRSTDPAGLWTVDDPIGPENDATLARLFDETCTAIIAAWGAHAKPERIARIAEIADEVDVNLWALGLTKSGAPRHPLYLRADTLPVVFELPAAA